MTYSDSVSDLIFQQKNGKAARFANKIPLLQHIGDWTYSMNSILHSPTAGSGSMVNFNHF